MTVPPCWPPAQARPPCWPPAQARPAASQVGSVPLTLRGCPRRHHGRAQFPPVSLHQTTAEQLGQEGLCRGAGGGEPNPQAREGSSVHERGTEYTLLTPWYGLAVGLGAAQGVASVSPRPSSQNCPWPLRELLGQRSLGLRRGYFFHHLGFTFPDFWGGQTHLWSCGLLDVEETPKGRLAACTPLPG